MSVFPRVTPESVGIPSMAIEAFLNSAERGGFELHSLMVLRHGKVCAEGWWRPYGPDKPHNIHSFTKTFLATALGIVVEQGKLSVEDYVLSFFPDEAPANPGENLKKMKIRHLLTMNTGHEIEPPIRGEKDFIRAFFAWPVDHEPGTWFRYNSNASHMIGRIIHKATGKTFIEVLEENLFGTLGITGYECALMADGFPAGGGGLAVKTEDMAKLAQLYLNLGRWNGAQLLCEDWIKTATTPQSDNANGSPIAQGDTWQSGYGYQLWINPPRGSYRFDGAHCQIAVVCPEQDLIVAFTAASSALPSLLRPIWDMLLPNLAEGPLPENPGGLGQLRARLENLALPELRPGGVSMLQGGADRKRVSFRKNDLLPVALFAIGGAVTAPEAGVSWIEPEFGEGKVKLCVQTPEQLFEITAGMNGEAIENRLSVAGQEITVYASAKWTDQNVLSVTFRQLRAVQITTIAITYHMDGAELSIKHFAKPEAMTAFGYY